MRRWPESFGDPAGEYLTGHEGAGYVGGAYSLSWTVGPDTVAFLQGLLSQDVESMRPGRLARSFLLQPRGKLEALLWVLRDEGRVGIVTDSELHEEAITYLLRWRLRVEVDFERDQREVFAIWGPDTGSLEVPDGGWKDETGVLVARLRVAPIRYVLVAGLDAVALESHGIRPIGAEAATTLRIEAGEPRMGIDVDAKTIPQESGLVQEAVSFDKGCFLGQELAARIDSRGRVNRNLRGIRILDPVIPPIGARVTYSGKMVGKLTSVGESGHLGSPVGLALIRREAPPGTRVAVSWEEGEVLGQVEDLPMIGS